MLQPPCLDGVRSPSLGSALRALSVATEFAMGQDAHFGQRSAVLALGIGRRLRLDDAALHHTHLQALLHYIGCNVQTQQMAALVGDERKDKPIVGMLLIRNVSRNAEDKEVFDGGGITDPDNGKIYRVRLKPLDGGKTLQLRGYIGPFYRAQLWLRVE